MRGPKQKDPIVCPRCSRFAVPVRGYCKNCATTLVRNGTLPKILVDNTPRQLIQKQEEFLIGLMLGDGCLYRRKPTHNTYLVVVRSRKDRDFLSENYNIFKNYCKREVLDYEVYDRRTHKVYYSSRFVTRRCPVFNGFYDKWYPNGEKRLPSDLSIISPLSLAIWFADDGNVRPSCSPWRMQMQLSTDGFTEDETNKLREYLEELCGEYFYLTRSDNGYRIGSSDAGSRAFFKIIDPYFSETMQRKAYWRKSEARFYENKPKRINPDIPKHNKK